MNPTPLPAGTEPSGVVPFPGSSRAAGLEPAPLPVQGQRLAAPRGLLPKSCLMPSRLLFPQPAPEFSFNILFLSMHRDTETLWMTHSAENSSELKLLQHFHL